MGCFHRATTVFKYLGSSFFIKNSQIAISRISPWKRQAILKNRLRLRWKRPKPELASGKSAEIWAILSPLFTSMDYLRFASNESGLGCCLHLSGIRKISNFISYRQSPCILISSKWIILTDLNAQRPDPLMRRIAIPGHAFRKAWYFQWHIHNHQIIIFAGQTTRNHGNHGRVYEPSR